MSQVCASLLVLITSKLVSGYPSETIMVMPPFEVRTLDRYPYAPHFEANRISEERHPILHTSMDQDHLISTQQRNAENNNYSMARSAMKTTPHKEKETHIQPAPFLLGRDSNESPNRPYPGSYGSSYNQPSAPSYGPPSSYKVPSLPAPTPPALPALPILKPDLSSIFKPISTKVAGKGSGLLSLILSLFGSSGFQLNGLKDILVTGVIQPLLAAKVGIKSIIAKLAIPVVALILINLEVLVTVWWLWEDCPVEKPSDPTYSYQQPAYNNNYNSHS